MPDTPFRFTWPEPHEGEGPPQIIEPLTDAQARELEEAWKRRHLTAHKMIVHVPIPADDAMDLGLIPDTRTPTPTPWRQRLRRRIHAAIHHARHRLGAWIAGIDPQEWQ